jgi:hypothetical protein
LAAKHTADAIAALGNQEEAEKLRLQFGVDE